MQQITTQLMKFGEYGEKSGWTYLHIPHDIATALKPGNRKSFRVKGKIDDWNFSGVAVLPFGDGSFFMPVNASMRKVLKKNSGADVMVVLEVDTETLPLSTFLLECLDDEPAAKAFFQKLAPSHQRYFSKWIESAKTMETKVNRIAKSISALSRKMDYPAMIREGKNHS